MSAEASSVPSTTGSAGTSVPRWAKANDQSSGSAFGGLTRGGKPRGTGRGRGGRGSRGAASQEAKTPNGDSPTEKKAPAKSAAPSSPALSAKPPAKSNESSGRGKPSSRRPSRANSTTNSTSFNPVTESTGSTTSTRSRDKRRRSQGGKGAPNGMAPIRVPSKDDSLLHPRRLPNVPVPLSAPPGPAKETPAPLSNHIKQDVDAFVERVRAAAMAEHRPSTPGSHIDWAGDDDDSLPDLDDWGIPSTSRIIEEKKTDLMSPLVVDGLTSLPAVEVPPTIEENPTRPEENPVPQIPVPVPQLQICPPAPDDYIKENISPKSAGSRSPKTSTSKPTSPRNSNFPNNKRDPTRKPPRRSPLSTPTIEQEAKPAALSAAPPITPEPSEDAPQSAEKDSEEDGGGLTQSMHAPSAEERLRAAGLTESIHAPKGPSESISAPVKGPNHRTHGRSHTTGRVFRGDSGGRGFRGHGSPRGRGKELSGGQHNRTRSTPTGAGRGNHMHRERPVLNPDAITRIAKTIGGSANTSPGKTPVATVQD